MRVTRKGRVTIPRHIGDKRGIEPGDRTVDESMPEMRGPRDDIDAG